MIASLVLASFVCATDANNLEKCDVSYPEVWQGKVVEYHADQEDCLSLLTKNYPDLPVTLKDGTYTFSACYRVVEQVEAPEGAVYLQNIQDADDSLLEAKKVLTVDENDMYPSKTLRTY